MFGLGRGALADVTELCTRSKSLVECGFYTHYNSWSSTLGEILLIIAKRSNVFISLFYSNNESGESLNTSNISNMCHYMSEKDNRQKRV